MTEFSQPHSNEIAGIERRLAEIRATVKKMVARFNETDDERILFEIEPFVAEFNELQVDLILAGYNAKRAAAGKEVRA